MIGPLKRFIELIARFVKDRVAYLKSKASKR